VKDLIEAEPQDEDDLGIDGQADRDSSFMPVGQRRIGIVATGDEPADFTPRKRPQRGMGDGVDAPLAHDGLFALPNLCNCRRGTPERYFEDRFAVAFDPDRLCRCKRLREVVVKRADSEHPAGGCVFHRPVVLKGCARGLQP